MKNQTTILDMLFEQKNKAYGAYDLRTKYSSHLLKAFIIGTSTVLLIVLSSFAFFRSHPIEKAKPIPQIIDLTKIFEPPIEIEKVNEEPNLPIEQPILETVRSVDPVAVEDEKAQEERIPNFTDLEDVVISTITAPGLKLSETEGHFGAAIPTSGNGISPEEPVKQTEEPKIFDFAETQPSFASGQSDMYKWLGKNLRYPRAAQASGTQGTVFVAFIVEKNGSISDVKVIKGIGFGCDEEAIKTIKTMPNWNPGMQNGKPVRVRFTIPIKFKLN